jgi:cellulose synthase/poly-beta-1,6-N-acetylglucosamine synthase-like glycosyltransferase
MAMLVVSVFLGVLICGCAVYQNHCTAGLLRCLKNASPSANAGCPDELATSSFQPQTVVILCLRGADPQLSDCLSGLLQQDYEKWELRIVVDHANDPSLSVVENLLARESHSNVTVRVLKSHHQTCSLKLSALSQELTLLDDECEAVVLVDADAMTYPGWLRDMVAPLRDPNVGAATGLRWFQPPRHSEGASMRYLWNLAAIGQMHHSGIAWGGSLAMRTDFVKSAALSDEWSRMVFEDTSLLNSLNRTGLRLSFVPNAIMVNTEAIRRAELTRYVQRQLLNARLYHPDWKTIFNHGILSTIGTAGALLAMPVALMSLNWAAAGVLAAASSIAIGFSAYFAIRLDLSIRQILKARSGRLEKSALPRSSARLIFVQALYCVALLSARRQKTVEWRGIQYDIDSTEGICRIRMREYRPIELALDPVSSIV